mgnify:CR=1 FL=1
MSGRVDDPWPNDPWPDDKILRLWEDLRQDMSFRIGRTIPADEIFGSVLWTVFSNNERVIDSSGQVVDVGTWRYAGGLVAALCGGDYMDYYMSKADDELVLQIRAALVRRGFMFTDFDSWEEGCLLGYYTIPPSWVEYFVRRRQEGV